MNPIERIEMNQMRMDAPAMRSGDKVRVHYRIREGEKVRTQIFEGVMIGQSRGGVRSSITVRKISFGVGVERIFPIHSPLIEKVELVNHNRVRRAKLYYLRALRGKAARLKELRK
ncbi:MAG: 50S ribosomal protein L19 [Deltaproteobacteria bacterium]|nr:MAG: 50S ribosomal protein L19 [Deltaproteobacteria bacterium]PLX45969.1 MAG: 50S ribosomal protein L19 [Deltaproteobacteria bacterium]